MDYLMDPLDAARRKRAGRLIDFDIAKKLTPQCICIPEDGPGAPKVRREKSRIWMSVGSQFLEAILKSDSKIAEPYQYQLTARRS